MVWQQQVSAIVMLCKLTESGICKCARYWPLTIEDDDLIQVPNAGLEVRLRDFDDQDKDFSVCNANVFKKVQIRYYPLLKLLGTFVLRQSILKYVRI